MTEQLSAQEVSESPFEKAVELLNVLIERPGGAPVENVSDAVGLIQSLLLVSLHNQMVEQKQVLKQIAERLEQEGLTRG